MGRGKHITADLRKIIIAKRNEGLTIRKVAEYVGVSRNAVSNALNHVKTSKTYDNGVRKPRAAKVTRRMKTVIRRLSESDRHLTSEKIRSETGFQISARTVRRILQDSGLHGRVARKKPFVSKINRHKRLQFAKEHLEWTEEDWAKVIFTDESKFCLHGSDGRSYVRRRIGEEFDSKCIKPTVKYGGGSLMVWGSMRRVGVGPICKIDEIINAQSFVNILQNTFLPYKHEIRHPVIYQ